MVDAFREVVSNILFHVSKTTRGFRCTRKRLDDNNESSVQTGRAPSASQTSRQKQADTQRKKQNLIAGGNN